MFMMKKKQNSLIDINFDFRTDTPIGKDPDAFSPTLRKYHELLWSKPLPNGRIFDLKPKAKYYLHHESKLGEFSLSSDSVIPSFYRASQIADVIAQVPANLVQEFKRKGYTIGGMMIFPSNRIDGKATINGARGFHPLIKDRFDLTLECVRLYYISEPSPLQNVFSRYQSFFALFDTFKGYIDFFFLQDWVSADYLGVNFALPFSGFKGLPLPRNAEAYLSYKYKSEELIQKRNERILKHSACTLIGDNSTSC
jgi:hypothetical protein